jgi:DNA-binding NtrC family response regulator
MHDPDILLPDILLVDDNAALRSLLTGTLRRLGWHVLTAASAEEALKLLKAEVTPRLLLTDIRMPGRNGFELAGAARERVPGLRVVFISGFPGEDAPPAGLGGCPMLSKPFTGERLLALVAAQLGRPGVAMPPPPAGAPPARLPIG